MTKPLPPMTTAEFAKKLGVSARRIRFLIKEGRVPGVTQHGRDWLIPAGTRVKINKPGRPKQ